MAEQNIQKITICVESIEQMSKENAIVHRNQQDLMKTQIAVLQNIQDFLGEMKQHQCQHQCQHSAPSTSTNTMAPPPTAAATFKKPKHAKK